MKFLYLWLSLVAIVGIAGMATLNNHVEVNGQGIGIFEWVVNCSDNGGGYFCNTVSEDTGDTQLILFENPDVAGDDFSTGVFENTEGCSPDYWDSVADLDVNLNTVSWPVGYLPSDKFGSSAFFSKSIAISSGNDPTLREALQSDGDGINKLTRQSVAALLNSAHDEINYPISIIDIISFTQTSIDNQEYSFADVLASYNNLGTSNICNSVE